MKKPDYWSRILEKGEFKKKNSCSTYGNDSENKKKKWIFV